MRDVGPVVVALLGGFRLIRAERPLADLPRGVQRLVAYVGLADRPARAAVAGELWPEVPEAQATGSLRSALWRVHQAVPGLIESSGGALALARGVRIDVRETARWARSAIDPRADVSDSWPTEAELRGDLLPGWYDDWVLRERERVRQLHVHAVEALADKLAGTGRYGEAVQLAYTAIGIDPLRESAHRTLVRIHRAEGNVAEAVHAYESFRDVLQAEMGAPPSARMQALMAGLRRAPARSTVVPLRDLRSDLSGPPARRADGPPTGRETTRGRAHHGASASSPADMHLHARPRPPVTRTPATETPPPRGTPSRRADQQRPPSYVGALEAAYALGRADGLLAAELGLPEEPSAVGTTCRGRDPEDFARLLWARGPGPPPSGLRINAPLWYARGFRHAVAAQPAAPTFRPGP